MLLHGTVRRNEAGRLEIGGCDAADLAARFGTPLYVMDEQLIRDNCRQYRDALRQYYPGGGRVMYAGKAFLCQAMAALAYSEGLGLDAVSAGELHTILTAGVPAELIGFHGNNKSEDEIELALSRGVGRIIADSEDDLRRISAVAAAGGWEARVLLRVTPGVNTDTHAYIRTGQLDSKFGVPLAGGLAHRAAALALTLPALQLRGLHCHLGSQLLSVQPFRQAIRLLFELAHALRQDFGWALAELNIGGGLGVRYTGADEPPTIRAFVQAVAEAVQRQAAEFAMPLPALYLEPGRSIVAEAGTTLYTVGNIKEIPGVRTYVAVDGGMYENPRPALYQAEHTAVLANRPGAAETVAVAVVGKCCETGDVLLPRAELPPLQTGDILAVQTTGAYNYAMASNYNRLPRPAVVFVSDGEADVVVARESYEDVIRHDRLPPRLRGPVPADTGRPVRSGG